MNTTIAATHRSATLDHRTGVTMVGGPASRYQRVVRCDGRHPSGEGARPNFAARRIGAIFLAMSAVMAGTWLVGEVAAGFAGQPASAASDTGDVTPKVHVARSGDTLWAIADQHRGDVGRNVYIDALAELNGGTTIHVGQAVRLP